MRLTNDFMLSFWSGAINWSNKNQPTIALLNMKVEYRGGTMVACRII
jgi:hypothetical protein